MCMACCSIVWNSPKGRAFHAILEALESVLSPLPLICLGQTEYFSLYVATHEQQVHINQRRFLEQRRKEVSHMRRIGVLARLASFLTIFAMLLTACGGGSTGGGGTTPTASKAASVTVGLVTDIGG